MKMNYFVVGTNNMDSAIQFYNSLFDGLPFQMLRPSDRMAYWLGDDFAFAVARPFDGKAAAHGNGTMVGFSAGSVSAVDELYAMAIRLGACCEGAPGRRGPRYSAYIRDLDGNKICLSD